MDGQAEETKPENLVSSKPKLDPYWNFRSVVFQVEDTLFSVLKHAFLVPGTPFEAMFSLPPHDAKNIEGSSDDNPIILEGTLAEDFRAFLRILYPVGVAPVRTYAEWVGVLRLSDKWCFADIRKNAISALNSNYVSQLAPHEKIRLGCQFSERRWISQGLVDIASRRDLEFEYLEAKPYCFDSGTISRFFYAQSKAFDCVVSYRQYQYSCPQCNINLGASKATHYCPASYRANITPLIEKCFAKEIEQGSFNIQVE